MKAAERYKIRRAAHLLGVPVPAYAESKYPGSRGREYHVEREADGTPILDPNDLACVRRLARENGAELPTWAVPQKPGPRPGTQYRRRGGTGR